MTKLTNEEVARRIVKLYHSDKSQINPDEKLAGRILEAIESQARECQAKLGGDVLYKDLAKRIFGIIFEHGREGQHDLELALMEIIQERESLKRNVLASQIQVDRMREALNRIERFALEKSTAPDNCRKIALEALASTPPTDNLEKLREVEKLKEYVEHDKECICSQQHAGRPTADGGYEMLYGYGKEEKWYREIPECTCGLNTILKGLGV